MVRNVDIQNAPANAVFAAVFGSLPLLQHLASYEFGLVWGVFAPIIMCTMLYLNTPIRLGSSMSKGPSASAASSASSGKKQAGKPSALSLSPVAPDHTSTARSITARLARNESAGPDDSGVGSFTEVA